MLAQNNSINNSTAEIQNYTIPDSIVHLTVNPNNLPLRVMFLNYRIDISISAIEKTTMHRAMVFRNYFGIDVTFLTIVYNSRKLEVMQEHYKTGWITPKNIIFNMFDYFQGITREPYRKYQEPDLCLDKNYKVHMAKNGLDKGVYKDNTQIMYLKYSEDKKLQYVSHSEASKLTRRDEYDEYGFLSRTQIFNGDIKNIANTYYREDGSIALQEFLEIKDGKSVVTSIHVVNKFSRYVQTYKSNEELAVTWLEEILTPQDYFNFCLVDRSNFYKYFILRNLQLPNLFIAVQLHSIHQAVSDYNNIYSKYNSDYAHCFEENCTVDVLIALTEQQQNDIILRNPSKQVYNIPHCIEQLATTLPVMTTSPITPIGSISSVIASPITPISSVIATPIGSITPPSTLPIQKYKVIYVARLIEMKEHRQAIIAFKEVVKKIPEATLYFYGNGECKNKLEAQIEELGLQNNIFLAGYTNNISEIFAYSALSILTSRFEGFSLSILESLNNGCPVVAFDVLYGPSEMVFNGENGYLVPAGDTKALADRIVEVLQNPALQQRMAIRSKEIAQKYFSQAIVAAKWKQMLDLAIEKFMLEEERL